MDGEVACFALEAFAAGAFEPGGDGFGGKVGAGVGGGVSEGVGGGVDLVIFDGGMDGGLGLEGDLDEAGDFGAGVMDEVEADVGVGGVVAVAMAVPVGGVYVDFEVAGEAAGGSADAEFGVEKVGAFFLIPASGVVDVDGLLVGADEGFGAKAGVGPEALDVAFGVGEEEDFGFEEEMVVGGGIGVGVDGDVSYIFKRVVHILILF